MRIRARGAGNRRRALLGVAMMLALLALALAALAVRQVSSETRAYLENRQRELEQRIEVALSHLERAEQSALDDLARALAAGNGDPREAERRLPLVDRSFQLVEDRLTWPRPVEAAPYGRALGADEAGTPLANRLLDRAYRLLADGDAERAFEAFEHSLERRLPPCARAEALLQMATILASDERRRGEAAACFDRILALEVEAGTPRARLLPWTLAARYRRAALLIDRPDPAAGVDALMELVQETIGGSFLGGTGEFTTFYLDRAFGKLSLLRDAGVFSAEQERRYGELLPVVREARAAVEFRGELETVWLPALRAHVAGDESRPQRLVRTTEGGARLLVFRGGRGDAAGVMGMRVDLHAYGGLLLEQLHAPGDGSPEDRGATVLARRGEILFRSAETLDEGAETLLRSELGGGLPWTVAVPVSGDLRVFRIRRSVLYGGLAAIVILVVAIASLTTLRGMQRAVELADLKSEFVANVSHELKTPLTLIRMFTDLLLLGYTKDPAEAQDNLTLIARETENLSLLIDNVLDLSRIDASEKEYHPAPADLRSLIQRGVDGYRPYLERRGFHVEVNLPAEFPLIDIDSAAFSRALNNLLSNSVKYSGDRKEVGIELRLEEGRALVEVADRGVGLRPGDAERVFDRFFRGSRGGNGSAQTGTGIGLAIVRHIVESHGGEVYAAPREGGGSRFSMAFPVTSSGEHDGERD